MPSLQENLTFGDHEDIVEIFRMSNGPMIRVVSIAVLGLLILFFFITPLFRAGPWGVGVFFLVFALCAVLGWRAIIKWMGSICVTTTDRIIVIERIGFWTKKVREVAYKEIVHGQYQKKGLMNTARDIGSVQCVLKSSVTPFLIEYVAHPQHLLEVIGSWTTFAPSESVSDEVKHESRSSFVRQQIQHLEEVKTESPPSLDEYWDRMRS